jgi:hypothetical protein
MVGVSGEEPDPVICGHPEAAVSNLNGHAKGM